MNQPDIDRLRSVTLTIGELWDFVCELSSDTQVCDRDSRYTHQNAFNHGFIEAREKIKEFVSDAANERLTSIPKLISELTQAADHARDYHSSDFQEECRRKFTRIIHGAAEGGNHDQT